jgi:predicted molibdopterin-dependent oxidoreductase YjgC
MTHPRRLEAPLVREGGSARVTSWDEALALAAERIAGIREAHGGDAVGLLLGPHLSNEEAAAAVRLARAIGTPHVDLCEPEDHAVTSGIDLSVARPARVETVEQIDAMNALLVVGDLFTVAPCMAKPVLNARYRERRHTVAVLDPTRTRTAWFGRPALRCEPAGEAAALAMMLALVLEAGGAGGAAWTQEARAALARWRIADLERESGLESARASAVVEALRAGPSSGVLLASEFGATARLDLVAGLAALVAEAAGARFLTLLEGANSAGIRATLDAEGLPGSAGHTTPEMLEAAVTGDVKALLVFGADPVAAFPGTIAAQAMRSASLNVVTAALRGPATGMAHVGLPSAVFGEKAGTVRGAFGTSAALAPVMAPPGRARPDLEVLEALVAAVPALAAPAPAAAPPPDAPALDGTARGFFAELDLFLRSEARAGAAREPGTHLFLAEASATNAADGSLTGQLSWARYAYPEPLLGISKAHAAELGVRDGDRVRVRSHSGEAELRVRLDAGLPEGIVTAPHRDPAVRGLLRWRREAAVRSLDPRPGRVSLERVAEAGRV